MKKALWVILICSIKTFCSFAQTGGYIEYSTCNKGEKEKTGVLKINFLEGNSINELTYIKFPNSSNVTLRLKAIPDTAYGLYANMTYLKMPDTQLSEYKIKIIGKDNINGYQCVKISLTTRGSSEQIVWITDKIPSYEKYLTATVNDIDLVKFSDALKKQNLKGIPVRMAYPEDNSLQYDFVRFSEVSLDKSIFSLNGYKEAIMMTSEEMKKQKLIDDVQFEMMKLEEKNAREEAEKQNKK